MQITRFFRPPRQPRSVQAQPLKTVLVPGKRKPLIKQTLPPVPPRIDNRVWRSVRQVQVAIAENRLNVSFREYALAETRAYELAVKQFESGFVRAKRPTVATLPSAFQLRANAKLRRARLTL